MVTGSALQPHLPGLTTWSLSVSVRWGMYRGLVKIQNEYTCPGVHEEPRKCHCCPLGEGKRTEGAFSLLAKTPSPALGGEQWALPRPSLILFSGLPDAQCSH